MAPLVSFDVTYPRYPFAPLVALGVTFAHLINRRRGKPHAAAAKTTC